MASQPRKLVAPSMRNNWRKWRAMLLWSRTGSELSVPIVLSILVLKLFLRMQFCVEIVRNCLGTWPISVNIFSSIQHVRASCTPGSWRWTRWHVRMLRWLLCPLKGGIKSMWQRGLLWVSFSTTRKPTTLLLVWNWHLISIHWVWYLWVWQNWVWYHWFFTVIVDLIFAPFGSRVNVMRRSKARCKTISSSFLWSPFRA